jgi:hypothetical protein
MAMIIATCTLAGCQKESERTGYETEISKTEKIAREVTKLIMQTEYHQRIMVFSDGRIRSMIFPISNQPQTETRSSPPRCSPGWRYGGSFTSEAALLRAVSGIIEINNRNGYGTQMSIQHYRQFLILCHRRGTQMGCPYCPPSERPRCPSPAVYFFPHPSNCHWFFFCEYGAAICKECPADLHWNVELETCDYPYRAGCR